MISFHANPSFFGNRTLGEVAPREIAEGSKVQVASLLDVAGTKTLTVQQRAQARDYLDIDALIRHGIDLPQMLAAGAAVWGREFNPVLTLRALSYFGDVPEGGYQRLVGAMASGIDVRLGRPATEIEASTEGVRVRTADGLVEEGSHVVVTVPLGVLKRGLQRFSPAL